MTLRHISEAQHKTAGQLVDLIASKLGSDGAVHPETAIACAMATAFIVKECARDIGADVAFNIAAFGFVEGSKTVPPALAIDSLPPARKEPWYRFW